MTRYYLRSLLFLLALAEAAVWIAIIIAQSLATMSVIKSETADALWSVYAIVALALIVASLSLIIIRVNCRGASSCIAYGRRTEKQANSRDRCGEMFEGPDN
jgi:hypothetical protein